MPDTLAKVLPFRRPHRSLRVAPATPDDGAVTTLTELPRGELGRWAFGITLDQVGAVVAFQLWQQVTAAFTAIGDLSTAVRAHGLHGFPEPVPVAPRFRGEGRAQEFAEPLRISIGSLVPQTADMLARCLDTPPLGLPGRGEDHPDTESVPARLAAAITAVTGNEVTAERGYPCHEGAAVRLVPLSVDTTQRLADALLHKLAPRPPAGTCIPLLRALPAETT